MSAVMQGIRILEVAEHTFVPAASAVLSDWGADVIKVEHAERGDAMRGLARTGVIDLSQGVHVINEHSNRGKRSIGIDLRDKRGLVSNVGSDVGSKLCACVDRCEGIYLGRICHVRKWHEAGDEKTSVRRGVHGWCALLRCLHADGACNTRKPSGQQTPFPPLQPIARTRPVPSHKPTPMYSPARP